MNPFRSRKKSQPHDGGDSLPKSSSEDVQAVPISSRSRTFRRKKVQPPPKKEIDLSTVLPPSDNFRTSLLMPNLSARFSMLREQDDPNTKIGKANDDSVLFPKRVSRLNLFGQDELTDIAEVASIAGSIRPPFAYARAASYASTDGYGTDDDASQGGSVMSRSRRGQGNRFFGGRQKIYKIPVGALISATDLKAVKDRQQFSLKGIGKAVYDEDVAVSAFRASKETDRHGENELDEQNNTSAPQSRRNSDDRRVSPPLRRYNHNRETSSSTASIPLTTRVSTAATSIASQNASPLHGPAQMNIESPVHGTASLKTQPTLASGPERTATKSKRMYGQGLNQQMYEQQSSAMHRLDSLQKQRGFVGTALSKSVSQSKSATALNERSQRSGPLYSSTNFRAGSPQPFASVASLAGFDLGLNEQNEPPHAMTSQDSESEFGRSSPISPPMSAGFDHATFAASLVPNDLGKATASGAFSKPRIQYNEQQYAERQLQLQEGRETPLLRISSQEEVHGAISSRLRNDSSSSAQSITDSKTAQPSSALNDRNLSMVPKAASLEAARMPTNRYKSMNGTFFAGLSGSESSQAGSERGPSPDLPKSQPTALSQKAKAGEHVASTSRYLHDDHHSILGQQKIETPFLGLPEAPEPNTTESTAVAMASPNFEDSPISNLPLREVDSFPLGSSAMAGLSGLIQTHLRNESNQSSIYPSTPLPESILHKDDLQTHYNYQSAQTLKQSEDNDKGLQNGADSTAQDHYYHASPEPLSQRAHQILEQAKQLRDNPSKAQRMLGPRGIDKVQQVLGDEAPRTSQDSVSTTPWQEQLKDHHHVRGGSTETEKERDDFASELASRRQRVQDNMKSYVESESRSASPMFGIQLQDASHSKAGGTLGLLKKASRGSLVGKGENPPKAMKMLGIASLALDVVPPPSSHSPREKPPARSGESRVIVPLPSSVRPSPKSPANPNFSFNNRNIGAERRKNLRNPQISPPGMPRDFSGSDHSAEPSPRIDGYFGRSRIDTASGDQARGYRPNIHSSRKYPPPQSFGLTQDPTMPLRSQSAMSSRSRSNSNSNSNGKRSPPNNLDPSSLVSPQFQQYNDYPAPLGRHPHASPIVPYAAHTTPPLRDSAPVHSASTTPTMISAGNFPSNTRATAARKRSVNKHDISDPLFINCTSSVMTVDLPPDASLRNGMGSPLDFVKPPVPPINPRRNRIPNPQNKFTLLGGKSFHNDSSHLPHSPSQHRSPHELQQGADLGRSVVARTITEPYEERGTSSIDEGNTSPNTRSKLRKATSEGGSMAARARQEEDAPMPNTPFLRQGNNASMF
ncbi:hypothetical protein MMC13_005830 [Lambiella insularis]|nr:hypothetical protein [Lambiella insularis]